MVRRPQHAVLSTVDCRPLTVDASLRLGGGGDSPEAGPIEHFKTRFIELLVECEAIRFGEFTLKSGRRSPYFIDAGRLRTGAAVAGLGRAYAERLIAAGIECDVVFGPSYKGVPLAVATAMAFAELGRDMGFCFDRKEAKDHGEGGVFVGATPTDGARVVVVDDVITSGTSVHEASELLRRSAKISIVGVIVAVDREERGVGDRTTLAELEERLQAPVLPVVGMSEIVEHLVGREVAGRVVLSPARRRAIEAYLKRYGPRGRT